MLRFVILLALLGLFGDDGSDAGRRGNELYREGNYAEAARAYRSGLAARDGTPDAVTAALWNNLGLALYRADDLASARNAFTEALATAPTRADSVRALYNAGNTAVAQDSLRAALDFYRRALRTDPMHENARYNYEYIKRRLGEQPPSQQQSASIEPSAYARRLKQRADSLVALQQYAGAQRLMQAGLRRDSTVAAYRSFMTRIGEVAQIDTITTER